MSDFKERFRAAAAERISSVPTKEQIRSLKAQKQAEVKKLVTSSGERAPGRPQEAADAGGYSEGALPSDFFQEPAPKKQATTAAVAAAASTSQPVVSSLGPAATPSAAAVAKSASTAGPKAVLPQGFFADKVADAKARGEKIPDEKDKEDDFKQFQRQMDEQIRELASKEAEEAEEDAEYREEREDFEQRLRMEQLKELGRAKPDGEKEEEGFSLILPARRRRVIDVLQEQLGGDSEIEDEEELLDWRAKGV